MCGGADGYDVRGKMVPGNGNKIFFLLLVFKLLSMTPTFFRNSLSRAMRLSIYFTPRLIAIGSRLKCKAISENPAIEPAPLSPI
jgi:hypothetical protein